MNAVIDFKRCYTTANACYPKEKNNSLRKRLRFFLRLFFRYDSAVKTVEHFFSQNPLRRFIISLPAFKENICIQQVRRSFYRKSALAHRSFFLQAHFEFMEHTHREETIRQMYAQSLSKIVYQDGNDVLSFSISCNPSVLKEGFILLSVAMNDVVLYKTTFWFMDYQGTPTMCIGALQGGRGTLEENHAFTKNFWGLRPQNMALCALRWYAQAAGVEEIYTFPKRRLLSRRICKQTDLDQFWQEQGATPVANTPFIRLDVDTPRKPISEIATRKRCTYKKRYQILDRLQIKLASQFSSYMKRSSAANESVLKEVAKTGGSQAPMKLLKSG